MAGYECSKPSALPTASNLDLKHTIDGIKAKLTAVSGTLPKDLPPQFAYYDYLISHNTVNTLR